MMPDAGSTCGGFGRHTMAFPGMNELLSLALVLLGGLAGGWLARKVRLPHIIGQILVGVLIGPAVLDLIGPQARAGLGTLTQFALGFIALTVGENLNIRALRNAGKRLFILVIAEAVLVPALVIAVTLPLFDSLWLPLLLGTMAVSTAPATIVALVKETRSRGVFVKTLTAAVAFNNIACIVLFSLARTLVSGALAARGGAESAAFLLGSLLEILAAIFLGSAVGVLLVLITRREIRGDRLAAGTIVALLSVAGLAQSLGLSVLLSCLCMGITLANLLPRGREIGAASLDNMETAVFAGFFTLAGIGLELDHLGEAGPLALAVVAARFAGKMLASWIGMRIAGATKLVRRYLGLALLPQAGVAVGLIVVVQSDPAMASIAPLLLTVGLSSVIINELVGSITAHIALKHSGDSGKDRPRLMDFIEEQHILTRLAGISKEEAIARLADLMIRNHHLKVDRSAFLQTILQREAQASTCVGDGLAIPHGILPEGESMVGVMGLSSSGLDLDAPDGGKVHCIVLLATPESQRDRHLQVIASLARLVDRDPTLRDELFAANSPAHAHDVLHAERAEAFNYYLTS
jgi:Kef-type K+ transport system membrane component KefB/mannitol/fructose-specific phosphotransferase system IIA component (Ntr-type)